MRRPLIPTLLSVSVVAAVLAALAVYTRQQPSLIPFSSEALITSEGVKISWPPLKDLRTGVVRAPALQFDVPRQLWNGTNPVFRANGQVLAVYLKIPVETTIKTHTSLTRPFTYLTLEKNTPFDGLMMARLLEQHSAEQFVMGGNRWGLRALNFVSCPDRSTAQLWEAEKNRLLKGKVPSAGQAVICHLDEARSYYVTEPGMASAQLVEVDCFSDVNSCEVSFDFWGRMAQMRIGHSDVPRWKALTDQARSIVRPLISTPFSTH